MCWFELSLGADSYLNELAMKDAPFLVLSLPLSSTKGQKPLPQDGSKLKAGVTPHWSLLLGLTLRC